MKIYRRLFVFVISVIGASVLLGSSSHAAIVIDPGNTSGPDQYITDLPTFTRGWATIVHYGYITDTCVPLCRGDGGPFSAVNAWKYTYQPANPWLFSPIAHNTRVWASVMPGTQRVWSWVWHNNAWYAAQSNRLLVNKAYYTCTFTCPIR